MKLLQINTVVNNGSTGRIVESIGKFLVSRRHQSYVAFGRGDPSSASRLIKIGNRWDQVLHGLLTRVCDRHGFGSRAATFRLIREIENIDPDIIHLHNIHGYYLNIRELFNYLRSADKPVVWTLHDCWSFTGHCPNFERVNCNRWQEQCFSCPLKKNYPTSWILDQSRENFKDKRRCFTGLKQLYLVTPSRWLAGLLKKSFLKNYPVRVIPNGINTQVFRLMDDQESVKERYGITGRWIILGVANHWSPGKGLADFIELSKKIPEEARIVLVGLNREQLKGLPKNILTIPRIKSLEDLASLYSAADVFVNPTYADNFPSTNLEALACGTPLVAYNTGGSPESIDVSTGIVVEKGNIQDLDFQIRKILENGKSQYAQQCRQRVEKSFSVQDNCENYFTLYKNIPNKINLVT